MNLEQNFIHGGLWRWNIVEPQYFRTAEFFQDDRFQSVMAATVRRWTDEPELESNKKIRKRSTISIYWPNDLK